MSTIKYEINTLLKNIEENILWNYKMYKGHRHDVFFEFCDVDNNYNIRDEDKYDFYLRYIGIENERMINGLLIKMFENDLDQSISINFSIINDYNDRWTLFTCDNFINLINKIFNLRYDKNINNYDNIKGSIIDHYIKYICNQLKIIIGHTPRYIKYDYFIPDEIINEYVKNGIMKTIITSQTFGYHGQRFLNIAKKNNKILFINNK